MDNRPQRRRTGALRMACGEAAGLYMRGRDVAAGLDESVGNTDGGGLQDGALARISTGRSNEGIMKRADPRPGAPKASATRTQGYRGNEGYRMDETHLGR